MNTQENSIEMEKSITKRSDESTNQARRSFLRMGVVAAPVIMTLASKPVFAVQGLSNMLSTTGSAALRGNCFSGGMTISDWQGTNGTTPENWGQKTIESIFSNSGHISPVADTKSTLLSVVNDNNASSAQYLVCGYLNAHYYSNTTPQYFMTEEQFWALYDGHMSVPTAYGDLIDLIKSNMGAVPLSSC